MFKCLVNNAFDFINEAIDQFREKPKYSVINFYSGLELLLKARLMAEHWTLIVSKRLSSVPDRAKFEIGDFQSVTFFEAAEILDHTIGLPLNKKEIDAFKNIRNHRNRLVHFYHNDISTSQKFKIEQGIAIEYLSAWYYVSCLLTGAWQKTFLAYKVEVKKITTKMQTYREYAEIKYKDLKKKIDADIALGEMYTDCPVCHQPAFRQVEKNDFIFVGECRVCETRGRYLKLESCPHCKKGPIIIERGYDRCTNCNKEITPNDIVEHLSEHIEYILSGDFGGSTVSCTICDGHDTVRVLDGEISCLNCFETFDENEIYTCEYCGEDYAGDEIEDSYAFGCGQCEGAIEH